jgi:taurine transport system permease protein
MSASQAELVFAKGGSRREDLAGVPDPRRIARRKRLSALAVGSISIVCFLALWETLTRVGLIDRSILPPPSMVLRQFLRQMEGGVRVLVGFSLSAAIAVPLGILLGTSPPLKAAFDPVLSIIRPLPSLSWIPLSMIWFGIDEAEKYSIVFMGTFAPLLVFVTDAARRVDPIFLKAARNLGASRLQLLWEVVVPAALPSILSALKVTLAISWACVISAEMVGATNGLGFLIWNAKDWGNIAQVIVGMLSISAAVVVLDALLRGVERRLLPWLRGEHNS